MATLTEGGVEQQTIREVDEWPLVARLAEGATCGMPATATGEIEELCVETRLLEIANQLGRSHANLLGRLKSQP